MSFVVGAITPKRIYVVGDTCLSKKEGEKNIVLKETAIKVFPLGVDCLVGITGDFDTILALINKLQNNKKAVANMSFGKKIEFVKTVIQLCNGDNNSIVAGFDCGFAKFVTMGTKYGFDTKPEIVHKGTNIRVLLPPDVIEETCKPYISSPHDIEKQIYTCIEFVSGKSDSVNNKMFGYVTDGQKLKMLKKNIGYYDITIKYDYQSTD